MPAEPEYTDRAVAHANEEWVLFALAVARVGVWELDLRSDAVRWSCTTAVAFGLDPEQSPTSGRAFIDLVHPADRSALAESHVRAIRDRTDIITEFRTVAPNGVIRWMQTHGRITYDHDGTPLRMLGVNIDISDRKALEEQLREVRHQVERLRTFKATMRTVQDIVGNALTSLRYLHLDTEPQAVTLFDQIVADTAGKLKVLGDLEQVTETAMAMGPGIEY